MLAERDFRKLFNTRLVSQTGDGVLTAGVGTYVFFNASTFPSPTAGAAAFAVLYLPYSLIGPFAGVFIDRWSRRQILVWSALIRAVFVVVPPPPPENAFTVSTAGSLSIIFTIVSRVLSMV